MAELEGAYEGLRVVDFTHVIAGPMSTKLLADHGADVVKIESRGGDMLRNVPVEYAPTLTSHFAQYNCGKRSIVIDLKRDEGRELALRLCEWADVVVENFSHGALDRLGLGVAELRRRNPSAIVCSISTFGASGPLAELPGFGYVAEAYSGLMWMNGDPGDPPSFFGTPLADSNAGVHAFGAIGAALHRRARTGEGTHIDLSSYDALVTMIDAALVLHSFTRGERRMTGFGTRHTLVVPAATVRTADGEYVAYGTPGDAMFRRLAAAMERPELAESAEYGTSEARVTNQDALYALIEEWGSGFDTAAELIEQLARHGVSGARIRTYVEAAEDPHLIERGTLAPVAIAGLGDVLVPSAPHHMTGARVAPRGPAPALGEHTREILSEVLGLPDTEIQAFIDDGVVNAAEEVTHVR